MLKLLRMVLAIKNNQLRTGYFFMPFLRKACRLAPAKYLMRQQLHAQNRPQLPSRGGLHLLFLILPANNKLEGEGQISPKALVIVPVH